MQSGRSRGVLFPQGEIQGLPGFIVCGLYNELIEHSLNPEVLSVGGQNSGGL